MRDLVITAAISEAKNMVKNEAVAINQKNVIGSDLKIKQASATICELQGFSIMSDTIL